MARYIDADALIEEMQDCKYATPCNDYQRGVNASVDIHITGIKHIPGADVAPRSEVAREIFGEIEKLIVPRMIADSPLIDDRLITDIAELKKKYTETSSADPKEAFIKMLADNWKWGEEE